MNIPKLRGAIAEEGLTYKGIAKEMGVSYQTLCSKLRGEHEFNAEDMSKLCKVLNIDDDKRIVDIFLR